MTQQVHDILRTNTRPSFRCTHEIPHTSTLTSFPHLHTYVIPAPAHSRHSGALIRHSHALFSLSQRSLSVIPMLFSRHPPAPFPSFPRRRESSNCKGFWFPACAGMTKRHSPMEAEKTAKYCLLSYLFQVVLIMFLNSNRTPARICY